MAKKKTYFKKKSVLKAISKYYRVTVSKVIPLVASTNGVQINGDTSYNLSELLTGTSTFQELGKQFALVKLRGVYIEVAPIHNGQAQGGICLALQQTNEPGNSNTFSQPNVMSVSDLQITRKYVKIGGTWEPTNALSTIANLKLAFQAIRTFTGEKAWTILIKLYLTFKSSM